MPCVHNIAPAQKRSTYDLRELAGNFEKGPYAECIYAHVD